MTFELRRPIIVDSETFFDEECSIRPDMKKRMWVGGNWHYTNHPKFYCYMLSWVDPITGERGVSDKRSDFPKLVSRWKGRTLVAANAGFDLAVLRKINEDYEPFNTFDVLAMSSYLQAPMHLDGATFHLLGKRVDKSLRDNMKSVHYHELSKDHKEAMKAYALEDSVVTSELFLRYKDQWPTMEQWISDFTTHQNWAGIPIDTTHLEEQIDRVQATRSKALKGIPWAETDADKPLSAKKLAGWCRSVGILPPASTAEDSEECQQWEAQYGAQYPAVAAMRDFRKSNTYAKKLRHMELLLRPNSTIPLDTVYAAAPHTLRFSARKFNYQSLPRAGDYCDLRGCLVPPRDHLYIGSDLAGIEARCLPWLAGDMDYLDEVGRLDREAASLDKSGGGDIYEPAARRLFGYADTAPLKKTNPKLRFATKTCVLQLGYQSGSSKFHWYIENNVPGEVLDLVRGEVTLDEAGYTIPARPETNFELAARLVKLYRGVSPKIVNLWYGLDGDLRRACAAGQTFTVQLPNGGTINYYDLAVREAVDAQGRMRAEIVGRNCRGEEPVKLYGGKITENIAQRMARDILVQTVYNLANNQYPTRFSVHDENVVEVHKDRANRNSQRQIEQIMSVTPDWAPGLPLAAETTIFDRYQK